jgi:hypothetical protein
MAQATAPILDSTGAAYPESRRVSCRIETVAYFLSRDMRRMPDKSGTPATTSHGRIEWGFPDKSDRSPETRRVSVASYAPRISATNFRGRPAR